ncbi:MAG: hypothetical protein WD766_10140 [Gemmatimonadota bacterium]
MTTRIFLLSPAHAGGKRAATLFRAEAAFDLALRLRSRRGAPMGEVFSYISGLYFRGKATYARAFQRPQPGFPGTLVITTGRGLLDPGEMITLEDLHEFAATPIDLADPRYSRPLAADAEELAKHLPVGGQVVLLGSIATSKYVELLLAVFGEALCFPEPFVGVGDMQRGAMLLRAAESGIELPYIPALGAVRSVVGARPRRVG